MLKKKKLLDAIISVTEAIEGEYPELHDKLKQKLSTITLNDEHINARELEQYLVAIKRELNELEKVANYIR